ncbi:NAD(P)-binding protein [Linnemannia elongata AG-77]|uniref:NAD(P)-binding protein n=1 Tax=Linnemannia elongata AG-77 TaxID=1314771 RepID=A0A197K5A1_9FUNG|nr:NAD(P)-binding protein [Linnemannia elongata AG-77]
MPLFGNSLTQLAWWKTYLTPNKYSHDQIPDLSGKVAIVTGANSGLGYATTVALAAHGARVFLACRSQERAQEAIDNATAEIKAKYPNAPTPQLEFLELDLNDMNKAHQAAQEFLKKGLPLHILVNNSGIMNCPFALSADGIETQFAVNHMGHFVFTMGLLDKIKESQPSRIVILSAIAHEMTPPSMGGIDFNTLNDPTKADNWDRYARSKLANVLFGKALARRLANEKVWVNIAHPGIVKTNLSKSTKDSMGESLGKLIDVVSSVTAMTPEKGALTQLYLATSPEVENKDIRGRYFIPTANEIQPTAESRDEELQERLWTFSENLAREKVKA